MANIKATDTDLTGYVQYSNPTAVRANNELFDADALMNLDLGVTGGAYDGGTGCNISFDFLADFDWNIPGLDFFLKKPAEFDTSFFDKCDAISLEFTYMNDMLINAILDMNCCDIAKTYNTTLVPFFQFFADSNHGGFMKMLVTFAQIITTLRAVIEPLECLIRFVPGNPWLYVDIDFLAWIYGYYKESKPFLQRIMSGEILDVVYNPVHDMRVKMQACLRGDTKDSYLLDVFDVGTQPQLEAISKLAVQNGNPLKDLELPKPAKPAKPQPGDYRLGENDPLYVAALKIYEKEYKKYEKELQNFTIVQQEVARQAKYANNITPALNVSLKTTGLVKVHTNGICGCVADALGLKNSVTIPIQVRTSQEFTNELQGRTIKGVTNKQAGTTSKDRPKDEPLTIEQGDGEKDSVKKACSGVATASGSCKKCTVKKESKTVPCPYNSIPGSARGQIMYNYDGVTLNAAPTSPEKVLETNDENVKLMKQAVLSAEKSQTELRKIKLNAENSFIAKREAAKTIIINATKSVSTMEKKALTTGRDDYRLASQILKEEIDLAWAVYNEYLATWIPFDFQDDPQDHLAISKYIDDGYWESPTYGKTANLRNELQSVMETRYNTELPFPPNTPAQNIINRLEIATSVENDERFQVNYFDSGFVREKGSQNWRNFNPLDLNYTKAKDYGSIGVDRTSMDYKAIYANDKAGLQACYDYTKDNFNLSTLNDYFLEFIQDKNPQSLDEFKKSIIDKYNYDLEDQVYMFSESEIKELILEIQDFNGYTPGKLWVQSRRVDPELKFIYEDDTLTISTRDGLMESDLVMTLSDELPKKIAKISNDALALRGHQYKSARSMDLINQGNHKTQNAIYDAIMSSAMSIPTEIDALIPCSCENFLCMLLNSIIQYVLSAFNKLIQEIMNMIVKFLIPDWIRDLLRLVSDMLACFLSLFGIFETVKEINQYAKDLLDSMRDRIKYYPDDPCFIPEDPFNIDYPTDDGIDYGDGDGGDGDDDTGSGGGGGGGYQPPIHHRPPVIYPPIVVPIPMPGSGSGSGGPIIRPPGGGGNPGNSGIGPVFTFACDYGDI